MNGKSTRDRALDIIGIAHPNFRVDLLKEADNMYLIKPEQFFTESVAPYLKGIISPRVNICP